MSPKQNKTFELSDEDLRIVAGGMDCATAKAVAGIYASVSTALGALGNTTQAAIYIGKAQGVLQGGCY